MDDDNKYVIIYNNITFNNIKSNILFKIKN